MAFSFLYCNADTLITDFVYALFWPHATHFCEWKVLEKKDFLSPGKPCNVVFASPGNVCTNPDNNRIVNLASGVAYVGGGTGEGRVQAAGGDTGTQAAAGKPKSRLACDILLLLYYKFAAKSIGERILKISQCWAKIEQKYSGIFFSGHGVYIACNSYDILTYESDTMHTFT